MSRKRRDFTEEFKLEAVRLVEGGLSQAQVARDLGVSSGLVGRWRKIFGSDALEVRDRKADQEELRRLRRENARLREEREILKKAAAYFARESK